MFNISVSTAPKEKPPETTKASKNKRKKMKKKQKRQRQLLEQQISQLRELELHQTQEVSSQNDAALTGLVADFTQIIYSLVIYLFVA